MKASLIIFVVALVLIVLDFIEASPFPQAKGNALDNAKGKDNNAKGKNVANAKGKGNNVANAKGKDNNVANAKGNVANAKGKDNADSANSGNINSANPSADSSNQICKTSKFPPGTGVQSKQSSCITTQMGELPAVNKMTSSLIVSPKNGQIVKANTVFPVQVKITNLNTGFFSDPAKQYYTFSQELGNNGAPDGHSHITIQDIGNGNNPPDAQTFAFFKGLNDPANNGVLSVDVTNGLRAGNYRLCTMSGSFSHQPLLMPVAQRGAQDDCIRFTVK